MSIGVQHIIALRHEVRRGSTEEDAGDIRLLARELGLTSSAAALELVLMCYPADRLPVRTRLLLEELLDDRT